MSSAKVKKLKRVLNYTATWLSDVLTVTTDVTHYLKAGDKVTLLFADSPQDLTEVSVVSAPTSHSFTIALTASQKSFVQFTGMVQIPYFSSGQTGTVSTFGISRTESAPSIIQLTAHGTGGAVVVVSVSNDGEGWIVIGTITLTTADLATDFISISPMWMQGRLSVTSIGASTTVVATVTA